MQTGGYGIQYQQDRLIAIMWYIQDETASARESDHGVRCVTYMCMSRPEARNRHEKQRFSGVRVTWALAMRSHRVRLPADSFLFTPVPNSSEYFASIT